MTGDNALAALLAQQSQSEALAQQSMLMAQSFMDSITGHSDDASKQASKELPKNVKCHLLGLSGFGCHEQDKKLALTWDQLHKQLDQKRAGAGAMQVLWQLEQAVPCLSSILQPHPV